MPLLLGETGGFHFCGKKMIVPSSPIPSDEKELDRNIFYWRRHFLRNTTPGPATNKCNWQPDDNKEEPTTKKETDGFNSIRRTVSSRPSSSSFPIFFSSVKASSSTASNFLFSSSSSPPPLIGPAQPSRNPADQKEKEKRRRAAGISTG